MSSRKNNILIFWLFTLISSIICIVSFILLVFFTPSYVLDIEFASEKIPVDKNIEVKENFSSEYSFSLNKVYHFFMYMRYYSLYVPIIEKKLEEKWMPDDLKYIAIAESFLDSDAVSHKYAAWMWQFMPETAKRYWLKVDEEVDERYDFEKSTDAALLYLEDLYKQFWNRILVVTAYNRWENGLKNDLKKQNVNNFFDLETNNETSNYLYRILDVKYKILHFKKYTPFL